MNYQKDAHLHQAILLRISYCFCDKMISVLILNSNILYYVVCKLIYNYFYACRWHIVSKTM